MSSQGDTIQNELTVDRGRTSWGARGRERQLRDSLSVQCAVESDSTRNRDTPPVVRTTVLSWRHLRSTRKAVLLQSILSFNTTHYGVRIDDYRSAEDRQIWPSSYLRFEWLPLALALDGATFSVDKIVKSSKRRARADVLECLSIGCR